MPERHSLASTPQPCTTPRRSPRFLHPTTTPQPPKLTTPPRKPRRKPAAESENPKTPKSKLRRNEVRSLDCGVIEQNDDGPEMEQGATVLRKSRRLLELKERAKELGKTKTPKYKSRGKKLKKLSGGNAGSGVLNRQVVAVVRDDEDEEDSSLERVSKEDTQVAVRRKRKRGEEGDKVAKGWTKEQELALQRAYLLAKPTPGFWKHVAKLVPGKSAQDCFDRIHSDHITPPQLRPRLRAKIATNSFPLGGFSLSASKLLNPIESKPKRHGCNKHRSHLAQKTVRALLHKHYQVHQDFEADLFSVLEPSVDPSTETPQPSVIPSTPINSQVKQGFPLKSSQISPASQKKPLSRFSNLSGTSLVSPPVLKQVKNKVLHEKYIDQLHIRESKRKTLAKNTKKFTCGIDDTKKSHIQKVDLRTAKIALVSDARDAINKLKYLQENSLESDDEEVQRDDEEDEDETL